MSFRTIRRFLAPRWLTEGEGGLVGYALDLVKDGFMERARLSHLYRFPQQDGEGTPGVPDALAAMGRDRRVWRGIGETAEDYALRLRSWLIERRTAGNPYTLMRQLQAYVGAGSSFRIYDVRGTCYSLDAAGAQTPPRALATGWDWDGDTAAWSRFFVVVYPGTRWVAGYNWGDPEYGDTLQTWGSTMVVEHAETLRAMVRDWSPGGTLCQSIILALDPSSFDPASPEANDGLWRNRSKIVAGVRVRSRLSTARYLRGY